MWGHTHTHTHTNTHDVCLLMRPGGKAQAGFHSERRVPGCQGALVPFKRCRDGIIRTELLCNTHIHTHTHLVAVAAYETPWTLNRDEWRTSPVHTHTHTHTHTYTHTQARFIVNVFKGVCILWCVVLWTVLAKMQPARSLTRMCYSV